MSGAQVIIIKKKAKGHGAHGAAWKVAYADFVTAMMALFMVMWLLSQTDKELQKELSEYFRTGVFSGAPSILEGGSGLLDKGFVDVIPDSMESHLQLNAEAVREVDAAALHQAGARHIFTSMADLPGLLESVDPALALRQPS